MRSQLLIGTRFIQILRKIMRINGSRSPVTFLSTLGLALLTSLTAQADDLDVFTASIHAQSRPNILFVLDYSGSMGDDVNGDDPSDTGLPSKESILEAAVSNLLAQNADRLNAGLLLFSSTASGVKWPISDLTANAHSIDASIPESAGLTSTDIINQIMSDESANGWTATVSALAEAALYFRGDAVANGGVNTNDVEKFNPGIWSTAANRYVGGSWNAANRTTYTPSNAFTLGGAPNSTATCNDHSAGGGTNHCNTVPSTGTCVGQGISGSPDERDECSYVQNDAWSGANYISPITDSCQDNYIILISDGKPTSHWDYPALSGLLGQPVSACEDLSTSIFSGGDYADNGNCGPEIVAELNNNDQISSIAGSNVKTSTIGFKISGDGADFLERIANDGGGTFYQANDATQLVQALNDAANEAIGGSDNFSELSIDIDKAKFANDNRVFFPLFSPARSTSWEGNLKGYFIDSDGIKDINNTLATVTDTSGTRFVDTAHSFWSTSPDGNELELGGASAKLSTTARNIYTLTAGSLPAGGAQLNRADGANLLEVGNSSVTAAMLGVGGDAEKNDLINWLHGAPMGAPLHSRITTLRYVDKTVVFVMTNQGLLHAIDATSPTNPTAADTSGGSEIFAFIPPELLPNLAAVKSPQITGQYTYGLDGGMTRWHDDTNNNGLVDGSETVQLIFGMRRGGSNYYALDVTDPQNPVYKWKIEGGLGQFADLEQSWSRPSLVRVKNSGSEERVLVFGGGYDAGNMDSATTRTNAGGNTVFMVDRDGNRLWSASHANMTYSIPADINVIDSDNDGIADRMYFGDLGGQLWRVDFDDIATASDFHVQLLADLGADSFQPFFYTPSVALNGGGALSSFISVSIGSGNRTNPMDALSQNRLFMVKDENATKGPIADGFATVTLSNLYDATSDDINSSDSAVASDARDALAAAKGWYINLTVGEKSLSPSVSFEGRLLLTTFLPLTGTTTPNEDSCHVVTSQGRYYSLNILDASASDPLTNPDDPDYEIVTGDRSKVISSRGIPSSPVVVFPPGTNDVQIVVDKSAVSTVMQRLDRVMWHPRD